MISKLHIPQNGLAKEIVHSIWQVEGYPEFGNETLIPSGIVEIIFDLEESFMQADVAKKQYRLPKCFINGFNTSNINLYLPQKHAFFGIRFYPSAIKALFGVASFEFANCVVDATLINSSLITIWHRLKEKASFAERVNIIINWLHCKAVNLCPREKLLNHFLYNHSLAEFTIAKIASHICYSERHLSRKIYELTGMNTERTLLYKKYLHAIHLMHSTQHSLTKIGYQSGFFDQSHFIKSFKFYAEMTPGAYRQNMSQIVGHIYK